MTEPLLIQRQRTLLHDLVRLVAERSDTEPEIERSFKARTEAAEREFQEARQAVVARQAADKEAAERDYNATRARLSTQFETDRRNTQQEISATRRNVSREYSADKQAAKSEYQEARWTLNAVFEADKNRAEAEHREAQERVADHRRKMQALLLEANRLVQDWRGDDEDDLLSPRPEQAPADRPRTVPDCIAVASDELAGLKDEILPRFRKRRRLLWLSVLLWLVLIPPLAVLVELYLVAAASFLAALVIGFAGKTWLHSATRGQVLQTFRPLKQALADAAALCTRYLQHVKKTYKKAVTRARRKYSRELRLANARYTEGRKAIKSRRDTDWEAAEQKLRQRWTRIRKRRDADDLDCEEKYQRLLTEIQRRYETDWQRVHDEYFRGLEENKKKHGARRDALVTGWQQGMARVAALVAEINRDSRQLFPAWDDPSWAQWEPPATVPAGIRFGEYQVTLADLGELPREQRPGSAALTGFALPACLAFPDRCSMLFQASDEGRTAAVDALQTVMLRLLTTLPPGKVRFTIVDPVGLGQNFAAFMHLADYDDNLVASRIWTELPHIEQRLADLTGHMENVIQKYLRNQFQSIEEYNAHAGEVAEPFRVLVVANFPANFSVEATRRLVSIASSGARCGVYTLITVDAKQPLPQGFNLGDLEGPSVNLTWQGSRFVWKDPDFEQFPLRLDPPPSDEVCTRLMHRVGEKAKFANRVEVPFEFITPPPERWWKADSRTGINVPLGRAGATKRQHLELGHGTAHHVLIAGKTGSGKSTLLHALITNLALCYSPDEVELYLVDFKKGVEFKTYATHQLPHARVVAVESEREFGLSVLQRLDAELRIRGDRFRESGAQNLAAYREVNSKKPVPRILLIVDEFQEFFIEDDKISQEAAQLLDRLVRQGRAFGLHVLLGSQTLGGAYTLARSTIDQMAVRIALQCSEADGHIILSDDNSAARLLSRPGEAIYNDANGLVEGNNPFQVVWLSDEDREVYLQQIHERDRSAQRKPQIVFEGNVPADVTKNPLLAQMLHAPRWPAERRSAIAWLGEAIAIKDPTAATFRPQSGNNLLIIGQHDESALGILATTLVSLAAQHAPSETEGRAAGARFYLLDGSPDDSPLSGFLGRVAEVVPHPVRSAGWRDLPGLIAELADEVDRRQKANETDAPALYLFIFGLQRFRDLRKPEDDFSFSRRGEEKPSASKQFGTILREGPALAVHTLLWCDSLNNVNRSFDRQALREFEMRILFQMSATDSSVLIDTPLAGKLGLHRALFHSEDQGKLEKFRPYGLPPETWLTEVGRLLRARQAAESAVPAVP
jgi:hypothetical protein